MDGDGRDLILFVLSSLMVAEERITTKFSGLVGAYGTEEEATFLATQQVDEARHMQFYARFQDEVVAAPDLIAAHVERAREHVSPAFAPSSTRRWSRPTSGSSPSQRVSRRRSRFVTLYHLILEGTLGLTTFKFTTDYLDGEGLLPGFVDGYSKIHHDETRHIGYGVWFLRETLPPSPRSAMSSARRSATSSSVAASLSPPGNGSGRDFDAIGVASTRSASSRWVASHGASRSSACRWKPCEGGKKKFTRNEAGFRL